MRPVLAVDLICAGRAVLAKPEGQRTLVARQLIEAAETADVYCRSTGNTNSTYGDGTLASAARLSGLKSEPAVCDHAFAKALILVLETLVAHTPVN
jgi:hypothetical protein